MRKLVVSIVILLAVSALALTVAPGANAQAANVKVVSYSYYFDSAGYLDLVGEVQNVGSSTVANVTLYASITGSAGSSVQQYSQILATYLLPGDKSPFYIEIHSQTGTYGVWDGGAVADVTLTVANAPIVNQYQYQEVSISNKVSGNFNDVFWANGTLTNTGTQTAGKVAVLGTFYNSAGKVVAVGWSQITSTIAPGASTKFSTPAFDQNQSAVSQDQKIASYKLLVDLKSPIRTGASPTSYPTDPSSSANPVETVTPSSGVQSDNNQTTLIIIIVVVVAVALVAVVFLLRRHKLKEEGKTKPEQIVKPKRTTKRNKK
jgi:hypothetical protein